MQSVGFWTPPRVWSPRAPSQSGQELICVWISGLTGNHHVTLYKRELLLNLQQFFLKLTVFGPQLVSLSPSWCFFFFVTFTSRDHLLLPILFSSGVYFTGILCFLFKSNIIDCFLFFHSFTSFLPPTFFLICSWWEGRFIQMLWEGWREKRFFWD